MPTMATKDLRFTRHFLYGDDSGAATDDPVGRFRHPRIGHEKFITWARELKNDEGLLIAILDCLSEQQKHNNNNKVPRRDPVRVAQAYTQLKNLDGHEFNITETSFFDDPRSTQGRNNLVLTLFVLLTQIIYTLAIVFTIIDNILHQEGVYELQENATSHMDRLNVAIIYICAAISLQVFQQLVGNQAYQADVFNKTVESLRVDETKKKKEDWYLTFHRNMCLGLNKFSNYYLGWTLYWLNQPFIFLANSPLDAILNGIATAFIIDIDDITRPVIVNMSKRICCGRTESDWNNTQIDDKLADFAMDYIRNDAGRNNYNKNNKVNQQPSVRVTRSTGASPAFLENQDYGITNFFLVYARDEIEAEEQEGLQNSNQTFKMRVFCAISDSRRRSDNFTHQELYEEINYEISGPGARTFFYDHIRNFQCVESCKVLPENRSILLSSNFNSTRW